MYCCFVSKIVTFWKTKVLKYLLSDREKPTLICVDYSTHGFMTCTLATFYSIQRRRLNSTCKLYSARCFLADKYYATCWLPSARCAASILFAKHFARRACFLSWSQIFLINSLPLCFSLSEMIYFCQWPNLLVAGWFYVQRWNKICRMINPDQKSFSCTSQIKMQEDDFRNGGWELS